MGDIVGGVSTFAASQDAADPLVDILRRAGAVFATQHGHSVAVNYGSAAGELAVCVTAVGILDRSELTKFALEAPAAQLSHLLTRLLGSQLAVGGARRSAGAWWCRWAADRVLVLCEPSAGGRLLERLLTQTVHHVALSVHDRSDELAAIALVGRATPSVLAALGAFGDAGDPRSVPPLTSCSVRDVRVEWLLESDRRALALVDREHAGIVWRAIDDAGRPFGISCVGQEAASRYQLLERSAALGA